MELRLNQDEYPYLVDDFRNIFHIVSSLMPIIMGTAHWKLCHAVINLTMPTVTIVAKSQIRFHFVSDSHAHLALTFVEVSCHISEPNSPIRTESIGQISLLIASASSVASGKFAHMHLLL